MYEVTYEINRHVRFYSWHTEALQICCNVFDTTAETQLLHGSIIALILRSTMLTLLSAVQVM